MEIMNKLENFYTEFIASLFNEEEIVEEVSLILRNVYPNKRVLSTRSLKRYRAKHGTSRRISQNTLDNLVAEAVEEVRVRSRHKEVY